MILANATEEDPEMLCSAARSWNNGVRERRGALYAIIHALIYERTSERSEWKRCGGADNALFEGFYAKNDHSTKTGLGQTQGKLRKERVLCRRREFG